MPEKLLNQSAPRKAWQDTEVFRQSAKAFWGVEVVGATVFGAGGTVLGFLFTPEEASSFWQFACPTIGGATGIVLGFITVFALIYAWNLFRAPYKQRNEARNMVRQLSVPSNSLVNDTIRVLQTKSLVMKHNNGEERSYSFAKVFLAIADQLSIGVSSIHFEGKIRKGLGIDEREEWYFPYEDEGIAHLIGVLVQNALVERRNEEYQHMTREVVSGATGIYLTPDAHLVKNVEVKYYLSPLGASVVKQLGQQSTVTNEVAKTIQELRSLSICDGMQGGIQINANEVLYQLKDRLAVGISQYQVQVLERPTLVELSFRKIVQLEQRRTASGPRQYDEGYWILTEFGKEVIQYLETNRQALDKEDYQT